MALAFGGGLFYESRLGHTEVVRLAATTQTPASTIQTSTGTLQQQLALVRQRQDDITSFFNLVLIPLSVITAIIGAGGLVGIVLSFRSETRSGQVHDLLYAGASAEQARTQETHATLLDASQKTLTLVNDTLALARDANDRAAKELSQRAERVLREISEEATTVFLSAFYQREFDQEFLKIVVEEAQIRNEVADLSYRLAAIEGPLEFQEIPLTPSAYLVKGLTHHLNQDEKRAIRFFERAVEARRDGNPKLIQLALYWTGYACNNVGQYSKAVDVFGAARRYADPPSPLWLELGRMEEESAFFDIANRYFDPTVDRGVLRENAGRVLDRLTDLGNEARRTGASAVAEGIATTCGNINFWRARTVDGVDRRAALDRAIACFEHGGAKSLWALFGLLEAKRARSPRARLKAQLYADVEKLAEAQTQRRKEQRSLTLLYLTSMICMRRQQKSPESLAGLLQKTFGDVDGALTLYSQYWKANVDRSTFERYDLAPALSGEAVRSPSGAGGVAALADGAAS